MGVSNFTRLLLVRCGPRFLSASAFPQSPPRSLPPGARPSESSPTPWRTFCVESGRACETVPGCGAADVPPRLQQPAHSSAATILRPLRPEKPLARRDASSSLAFSFCTKAPPPKAMILEPPPRSSPSTCSRAACSARRNSDSPESRKISATGRPSRASMRSSRSSKTQFSRSPSARPTLLFPAPMKPTRKTELP